MLVEGSSMRSISRVADVFINAVMKLPLVSQGAHKVARLLFFVGCGCLVVVALAHVAERFHLLPGMGWGLPDSPGHYLDLVSAIAGPLLLLAAYAVRRRNSN
jgi:hypothetical protein